ncbi:hypothetical protein ACA910_009053 [Epithemia clementina (nom. ined.)]
MKIVIVGGVAAGASAAARARRLSEDAEIVILQSGPDVSFASCGMPYFIGGEISDRDTMAVQTPESLHQRLNLDVRVNAVVESIDVETQTLVVKNASTGQVYSESYDQLVLAVGAAPIKPPIPGIDRPGLFALRNLQDMDDIVEWINKMTATMPASSMHCVVAGAGFVGLEMVEQLHHRGCQVTLVELQPQILAPLDEEMAAILHRDLEAHGVTVIVNDGIKEFTEDPTDPEASILTLGSGRKLPTAHLTILGLGVRPDTAVVKSAGINVTPRGHIIVDDFLHTSAKNVWAAGDAVQVRNAVLGGEEMWAVPLAGPANRQGRIVADNIFLETKKKYKGTYAVAVVRSFQEYAASVGMNEKLLRASKLPYQCVHIHPNSHAGYYPGASQIHLKVLFDKDTGKLYGAQAVGREGVEKRIDVIATAMQAGMLANDLAELELCYAPPVGSAKDPVNYAGMVAQNIMDGLVTQIEWKGLIDKVEQGTENNVVVLDVRGPSEIARDGPIAKGATNIPLNDLRQRMNELPANKDQHIVVTCASGQRAYYAYRILKQNGYTHVDNLGGAFATFHAIHPAPVGA